MTTPFITSADLLAYVVADALESDLANIALDAACEVVRGYCDQLLETTTVTDGYLDGTGGSLLMLPAFPVTAIAALSVYADRTDTSPEVLVENTDYVLDGARGAVWRIDGGVFTAGRQNIKTTYTYGASTVPTDAQLVALQVAARIYAVGMTESESLGGVSITYVKGAGSLTQNEKDSLRRYRR